MSKAKTPTETAPSSRYRFFCWAVAFLALAQLLVGLDYITIWPGAEARLIWSGMQDKDGFSAIPSFLDFISNASDYWLLAYRLPGLLIYLLGLWLFYHWGKSLFGQQSTEVTLLLTVATLFLPVMAKNASLDSWRFGLEIGCWLALLHFFKTPNRKWLFRTALLGVGAVIAGSWASLLLLIFWQVAYYRLLSPGSETLKKQFGKPFVIVYLFFAANIAVSLWLRNLNQPLNFHYFNFFELGHLKFLAYSLLGLAPFIGFTIASLRDLFYKLKRGEELSQLLVIGLLGSWLTLSLVFPLLLVFLTAKQMEHYFKAPNYPWQNWVKTAQLLHLITVFIVIVMTLLSSFAQFQGEGFRAFMGCGAAYWMFSFLGVIGLYGFRRDYVLGSMVLSGLLAVLFFWVQVYPFLHLQRNWPERLSLQLDKLEQPVNTVAIPFSEAETLPLAPYLYRKGIHVVDTVATSAKIDLMIRQQEKIDSLSPPQVQVKGWSWLGDQSNWSDY